MGWKEFVRDHRIPWRKGSGKNIEIHCSFCGTSDPSKHMGLHEENSSWACWRNEEHRGRNPVKLIKKLLLLTESQAVDEARLYFDSNWSRYVSKDKGEEQSIYISKPEEFLPILFDRNDKFEEAFIRYLRKRGLDAVWAARRYNLHYCVEGDFAWRLIIPIMYHKKWVSFVGRTLATDAIRFMAAGKTFTKWQPNYFLYDIDNLTGGRALILTEGFFDAAKINSCFLTDVDAIPIFGKVLTESQISALSVVSQKYEQVLVGFDLDVTSGSMKTSSRLSWYVPNSRIFVPSWKDWNSMTRFEIKREVLTKC